MIELLIVLDERTGPSALEAVKNRFNVTSNMPPRLAIVQIADASKIADLFAIAGVQDVIPDAAGPLPEGLGASAKLFAAAWQMRQKLSGKTRVGEGLPWDAPGFLPPDRPR